MKKEPKKEGRPLAIETPEKMLQHFEAYRKHCKSNPFVVKDWVGGAGKGIMREKERPLSMEGFECYLFEKKIINDLGDYISNKGGAYGKFSTICAYIRREIRRDQIDGGMAGVYNPSITQRLNNLVERTENRHEVTEIIIKKL